jgi:pilus assembly protein CpaF
MIDFEVVRQVKATVLDQLDEWSRQTSAAGRDVSSADESMYGRHLIDVELQRLDARRIAASEEPLTDVAHSELSLAVFHACFGLGALQPHLDDVTVEDVYANGPDVVWVRRTDGSKEQVGPIASSGEQLVQLVQQIAATTGRSERRFDLAAPRLNLRLADGARLFAVMEVSDCVSLTIRRNRYPKVSLADLVGLGWCTPAQARFLEACVRAGRNLVIGGGTATGKTTTLRALAAAIDPSERLVVIEDSAELDLHADASMHADVVSLEQRDANIEGEGGISMATLARDALRMSPDRVIVGECRGDEVIPMLLAMGQGNDGSMCTVHADSSASVFDRLALYAAMAPERLPKSAASQLIANSVHLVLHVRQLSDGTRVLSSVREVATAVDEQVLSNELLRPGRDSRAVPTGTPVTEDLALRLADVGFDADDMYHDRAVS